MSQMAELLENFQEIENGLSESRLKGVLFFKETQPIPRRPMMYNPGICIVAQGHMIGYLGGRKFRYDANHYLVTSVATSVDEKLNACLPGFKTSGVWLCAGNTMLKTSWVSCSSVVQIYYSDYFEMAYSGSAGVFGKTGWWITCGQIVFLFYMLSL